MGTFGEVGSPIFFFVIVSARSPRCYYKASFILNGTIISNEYQSNITNNVHNGTS